jgi:hypothetical protein
MESTGEMNIKKINQLLNDFDNDEQKVVNYLAYEVNNESKKEKKINEELLSLQIPMILDSTTSIDIDLIKYLLIENNYNYDIVLNIINDVNTDNFENIKKSFHDFQEIIKNDNIENNEEENNKEENKKNEEIINRIINKTKYLDIEKIKILLKSNSYNEEKVVNQILIENLNISDDDDDEDDNDEENNDKKNNNNGDENKNVEGNNEKKKNKKKLTKREKKLLKKAKKREELKKSRSSNIIIKNDDKENIKNKENKENNKNHKNDDDDDDEEINEEELTRILEKIKIINI